MRYIELNPVRTAMVEAPQDHRWSSVHTHLARASDPLITPHPLYLAMGSDPNQRAHAYQRWLDAGIAPDDLRHLRAHASQERALGDERFQRRWKPPSGGPPRAARAGGHRWQTSRKTFN